MQLNLRNNSGSRVTGFSPSYSNNYRHWKWIYSASAHTCDVYEENANGIMTKKGTIDLSSQNMTTMGFQITDWQTDMDCWIKDFKVYYA